MRNNKSFYGVLKILILIIFTYNITGCKKSSADGGRMQAMVDGQLIICDSLVNVMKDLSGQPWGVEGCRKGGPCFILQFPVASNGSYTFLTMNGGFMTDAFLMYRFNDQYHTTGGVVTVSESNSQHSKGTFSFSAKNSTGATRTITDGTFDASR